MSDELARIEELEKAATPGPWTSRPCLAGQTEIIGSDGAIVAIAEGEAFPEITDARLIVSLRNAAPTLLARLARYEKALASLAYAEGDGEIDGSWDEPASAQTARAALEAS